MLKEFQEMFVDPEDHSSLSFEGKLRNGCWHNGYLYSHRGEIWPVREGIPNFRAEAQGDPWTDEIIKGWLSDGTYERNWESGGRRIKQLSGFAEACREAADSGLPIVDIASGPGGGFMPSVLALNPKAVVMATDAGTPVLYGWKEYFDSQGMTLNVCFAGFDAMKMPLASNSVEAVTSAMGFSSIRGDPLVAFQEAARVLAPHGVIYAAEAGIEKEGLQVLSTKMGWDFEEKFGHQFKMSFQEMFDECNLNVLRERPHFRRKLRPDDSEIAKAACKVDVELWVGGDVYWLVKKG